MEPQNNQPEWNQFVGDPQCKEKIHQSVEAEYASQTFEVKSTGEILQEDIDETTKRLREAEAAAFAVDPFVQVPPSQEGGTEVAHTYTKVESTTLWVCGSLAVALVIADMVLFYAGLSQSPWKSSLGKNSLAISFLLVFVPAVACVLKLIPDSASKLNSKAYHRYLRIYSGITIFAGVVYMLSYLIGVHPVTSEAVETAQLQPAPATQLVSTAGSLRNPFDVPDEHVRESGGKVALFSFFLSGMVGTTFGAAVLLMVCARISDSKSRIVRNPHRELLDARAASLRQARKSYLAAMVDLQVKGEALAKLKMRRENEITTQVNRLREAREEEHRREREQEKARLTREMEALQKKFLELHEELKANAMNAATPVLEVLKAQLDALHKAIAAADPGPNPSSEP